MMSVNDIRYETAAASEARANRLRHWIGTLMAMVDGVAVLAIVGISSLFYHLAVYDHLGNLALTLELGVLVSGLFVFTNLMQGRYRLANYLSTRGQIGKAFTVWNITMVAFIAIAFLAKVIDNYSRAVVLVTYITGIPLIALARSAIVRVVSIASKTGRITSERVFLIGREADVMSFVSRHQPWNVGFVISDVAFLRNGTSGSAANALTADLTTAVSRVRSLKPDAVFIAMPWSDRETIERVVDAFMNVPVAIHLAPEQIMDRFENPRIAKVGPLTSLQLTRPALSFAEVLLKRIFDVLVASLMLLVSLPALCVIAIIIKLETRGPVFFMQRRYGFNQEPFHIYKFRSMSTADDGDVVVQASKNDVRITRVGAILRRYNLDELPQLLNVIIGRMSLVGPRPHALAHDHEYEQKIALYARRHNVKPGITGWAQVHGLRGETDTDDKMAKRVAFDHWYIDNWSFWLDVVILLRTLFSPKAFKNAL
jgi:Undecaprenyl-phosphate glucose phosphotransferase